ncbi:class I SAM-dependent methyltransferase, partial [Aspergillus brunneoviolaceus CBS 621.78]
YWNEYLLTRPTYPASFYNQIYNYHASASPSSTAPTFAVAHDIGAGPGHVALALSHKFPHVNVSDIDPRHLTYARNLHSSNSNSPSQFTYTLTRAEHLATHFPPASADLISSALMFPLLPSPAAALRSIHPVLKPHGAGTLAISFYGLPHFSDPALAAECQPLLDGIVDRLYRAVIQRGPAAQRAGFKREADAVASWLDCLAFPAGEWRAVERYEWNRGWARLGFFSGWAGGFVVESPASRVRWGLEKVVEVEDRGLWRRDWDVRELRRFVGALVPVEGVEGVEDTKAWRVLEGVMGTGVKRAFSWPVVLVFLAKR